MLCRRRQQRDAALDADASIGHRVGALVRYLKNGFLGLSCGYGERPSRVVGFSVAVILGYSLLYRASSFSLPFEGNSALDPVLFSVQAFLALIIGTPSTVGRGIAALVVTEAFMGAVLLALFVVTLTRSFDVDG